MIIESLIFASQEPLKIDLIAQTLGPEVKRNEIRKVLNELVEEYKSLGRGFYLDEVAEGYQFRTKPVFREWIRRLRRSGPDRLSQASLETMAIIAYRQPVVRAEIEQIRGVDVGGVLRSLLQKGFVKILGRKNLPGRPIMYGTSRKFLAIFGLKDLKDLPPLREIEKLKE